MEDTVIDLSAFAATQPRKSRLRQAIIRLRDAHSAKTDLMSADDFASQLDAAKDAIAASPVAAAPETIGLALLYSAVVLYARATKTTSDHRALSKYMTSFQWTNCKSTTRATRWMARGG